MQSKLFTASNCVKLVTAHNLAPIIITVVLRISCFTCAPCYITSSVIWSFRMLVKLLMMSSVVHS